MKASSVLLAAAAAAGAYLVLFDGESAAPEGASSVGELREAALTPSTIGGLLPQSVVRSVEYRSSTSPADPSPRAAPTVVTSGGSKLGKVYATPGAYLQTIDGLYVQPRAPEEVGVASSPVFSSPIIGGSAPALVASAGYAGITGSAAPTLGNMLSSIFTPGLATPPKKESKSASASPAPASSSAPASAPPAASPAPAGTKKSKNKSGSTGWEQFIK